MRQWRPFTNDTRQMQTKASNFHRLIVVQTGYFVYPNVKKRTLQRHSFNGIHKRHVEKSVNSEADILLAKAITIQYLEKQII